jgi:NAD+ synthase
MEERMGNLTEDIPQWIRQYALDSNFGQLVVGVSGGIDSAVVSTLCALSGVPTLCLVMPIRQKAEQTDMGIDHCLWLNTNYMNASFETVDLTRVFDEFENLFQHAYSPLALANSRARLRMMTLYQKAQTHGGLVVGTGNKVEDFGVGFYTKYGDGGVDISPIADLTKTEVWALGKELGVSQTIIDAKPTDGLWDDGRVDQDQLQGMSYSDLERCMTIQETGIDIDTLSDHEQDQVSKYIEIRERNIHKMQPIPVFYKKE